MTLPVVVLLAVGQLQVADSLLRRGFYSEAAAEYGRSECAAGPQPAPDLALSKGLSLGASGNLPAAALALHDAAERDSTIAWDATMALAGLYVRQGAYGRARFELSDLLLSSGDSARNRELLLRCGWLDLKDRDVVSAEACFRQAGTPELALAIRPVGRTRSPGVAAVMSSVIPGLGEVYAGRPLPGLLGFAASGASAWAAYSSARSGDWVLASVVVSTFFIRFYNGSRQNAALFATEYNQQRTAAQVDRFLTQDFPEPDWFEGVRTLVGPEFAAGPDSTGAR